MALTQEQHRAIEDWLAHHATIAQCPVCGLQEHHEYDGEKQAWWTIGSDLYGLPSLAPGAAHSSLDLRHGQVFASAHCRRCGYVMLFRERTITNPRAVAEGHSAREHGAAVIGATPTLGKAALGSSQPGNQDLPTPATTPPREHP
jgi:hypothetical protein